MIDELLTPNFYLSEFVHSDLGERAGLDNTPPPDVLATLRNVLAPGMQVVRAILGTPILTSSGYRSPAVNKLARGAFNSQHLNGHACDFRSPAYGSPRDVARRLVSEMKRLRFDQLIWEGSWVHVSFAPRPRNQVLTAHFSADGKATYTQGIA